MRFEGVLLLLALTILQVHGICLESARGNVLGANARLELFGTKTCGTYEEWELVPVPSSTNYYIKHVSTQQHPFPLPLPLPQSFLWAGPNSGIGLNVLLVDQLTPEYIWIETEIGEAASGVFSYQSQETLEYLSVDSAGVGLHATNVGLDEQFIKR